MRIVGAGMPGPLLLREQQYQTLQIAGIPPGLFPYVTYEEFTAQLQPGDSLLFCTDGLTEARNVREGNSVWRGLRTSAGGITAKLRSIHLATLSLPFRNSPAIIGSGTT